MQPQENLSGMTRCSPWRCLPRKLERNCYRLACTNRWPAAIVLHCGKPGVRPDSKSTNSLSFTFYCCVSIHGNACVFIYVKERGKEMVAVLCAALLLMTSVFQTYSVEARPYSMLVACFAFAIVCYQRLPSTVWTWLLAATFALAQSFHYYAVLAMVPFGLAEAAVSLKSAKVSLARLGCIVLRSTAAGSGVEDPRNRQRFLWTAFWAHLSFTDLPRMYGEFFLEPSSFGGGIVACVTCRNRLGLLLVANQGGTSR